MNLRAISNQVIQIVAPDEAIAIRRSTGFTLGAGHKQIPTYAAPENVLGQVQSSDKLSRKDLEHTYGLNVNSVIRVLYVDGDLNAVNKPLIKGGDLIDWAGNVWLVISLLETWKQWTKVLLVLQND